MLVLSRKASQTIRIGTDVTLTILGVSGNTVRIGLEAPSEVPILRGELCDQAEPLCWEASTALPDQVHPTPKLDLKSTLISVPASVIYVP